MHDLTAKMQSNFFNEKKNDLKPGEVMIGGDFSENFTPVIQDAIQAHHWNKQSTTIHPAVDRLFQ